MIRAVLFDLDDTLYAESSYVRSGFAAVGRALEARGHGDGDAATELFCGIHFGEGRDHVFDKAADRLGFPREWVPELVRAYREHRPTGLALFDEVPALLADLRTQYRVGVVTDGWTVIQSNKVAALGLEAHVDHVMLTDSLGRAHWKPHPLPFQRCLAALGVEDPRDAVFVGDNPERDIEGAHNAGLVPLWLRREGAYFFDAALGREPAATLRTLGELPAVLARLSEAA